MLNRWFLLTLVTGVVAGYAFSGPVRAQSEDLPFAVGDTVTLWYGQDASLPEFDRSVECTVGEIRGVYVKCGRRTRIGGGREPLERWFTLKYVVSITRREADKGR